MSKVDAKERVEQQVTTAVPEPPLFLRIYVFREANNADYGEVRKGCTDISTLQTTTKTVNAVRARSGF